jgi:CheY-like chemotaxis protein
MQHCFLILADNAPRIGPRKLCRVIRYAKNSTITRQPSDFGTRSSRVHEPSPTIVRGDRKTVDPPQESYFEIPRDGEASKRNSIITPMSFMRAALADSPVAVDSQQDDSAEQSNSDPVRRDLILLVEDNSLNMRVSVHRVAHPALLPDCTSRLTTEAISQDQSHSNYERLLTTILSLQLLIALMKKQHLPYDSAEDGLEALNKFKEKPGRYFLVFMDMVWPRHHTCRCLKSFFTDFFQNMPVMDGFESTAKIREHERSNNLRPANICAVTGVTSGEARSNAFNAGVDKYLTKPIRMKELTQLVADARDTE